MALSLPADISRLEKSPLLANGYNPPPTHMSHMQFMQMNHHPGAAGLLNAGSMPPHGMPRPDNAALLKGQAGMPGMNAITRWVLDDVRMFVGVEIYAIFPFLKF